MLTYHQGAHDTALRICHDPRGAEAVLADVEREAGAGLRWDPETRRVGYVNQADGYMQRIPQALLETVALWVVHAAPPGSFVRAVLHNDLRDAIGRADDHSLYVIDDLLRLLHNHLPASCYGSPRDCTAWRDMERAERTELVSRWLRRARTENRWTPLHQIAQQYTEASSPTPAAG